MKASYRVLFMGLSLVFLTAVMMAHAADVKYVGAKKCKVCHKKQNEIWETKMHAKAWNSLNAEEQKNPKCIKCHTTGDTQMPNVQCEACHGPGSEYSKPTIMNKKKYKEDPEGMRKAALAAGLIEPDKDVCVRCHNEESPNYKGFNFDEYKAKIKHWD